jgi:hypothetical protein
LTTNPRPTDPMTYVDGFLLVCPKKRLRSYVAMVVDA